MTRTCLECGARLRVHEQGREHCAACRARPTPAKLLFNSIGFMVVGGLFGLGGLVAFRAVMDAGWFVNALVLVTVIGGAATIGGAVDVTRALHALASGRSEVHPLGTKAVSNHLARYGL
jgi:hypothetical protein